MIEQERLEALKAYQILDTLPEKEFDDIVDLASTLCGTPISLISLLDSQRQWFKARTGLESTETPIEIAFCRHAIQRPQEVMVVNDTLQDERFKHNPLVTGDLHFRFYAGAPLLSAEGHPLGTLCIIDKSPRELTEDQQRILQVLARKVMERLELRKQALQQQKELKEAEGQLEVLTRRLLEAQETARIGSWEWDTSTNKMFWSPEMYRLFGLEADNEPVNLEEWMDLIHPDDRDSVRAQTIERQEHSIPGTVEYRIVKKDGSKAWMLGKGVAITDASGKVVRARGTAQDITEEKNQQHKILSATLEGEENERKRIARELHDSLGNLMAALSMKIQFLTEQHPEVDFSVLRKLTDKSIEEYRHISHNLYPPDILNKTLHQLIAEKVEELNGADGIRFILKYSLEGDEPFGNPVYKKELYRIFQELITNVIKHASASEVHIKLLPKKEFVALEVSDNGTGFDVQEHKSRPRRGIGLRSLFERAGLLGGSLEFNSATGRGTTAQLLMKR